MAVAIPSTEELRLYEYLDHTADVILHSWGKTLSQAFEQCCVCFFSYLTDLDTVSMVTSVDIQATGHDLTDLLYHLLDEFLFNFSTEFIICRRVEVDLDEANLRATARGYGEKFDLQKHPQGTEIKAITMHQMKILTPTTVASEQGIQKRALGLHGEEELSTDKNKKKLILRLWITPLSATFWWTFDRLLTRNFWDDRWCALARQMALEVCDKLTEAARWTKLTEAAKRRRRKGRRAARCA
ncbi:Protein archease (Protein ZBTB8OS) (Zinc finger and BTB domain-containing opposite strand protein 8) [Durusdinium trenchii]|uniref:Protein archease (Protein ZBTB8OS) (Zinc finger and BTB domain-containing opposite strand protein 8) n=1 Tax=Durusdinium trenchii TaxID=1381693 RepID=A0ABP0RAW1_9DINO